MASTKVQRRWATYASLACLLAISQCLVGCEDYRFQEENLALIRDIKDVLVKNGLCKDVAHCSSNQIVYSAPKSWGLDMEIYGVNDPEIMRQIDSACAEYFFRGGRNFSIKMDFYSVTKEEEVGAYFFAKPKPIIVVHWERINVKH